MKRSLTLLAVVLLFASAVHAQTEVWHLNGTNFHFAIDDGRGITYVLSLNNGDDTLSQVDPAGSTVWWKSFHHDPYVQYGSLYCGSGLYFSPGVYSNYCDSIFFIDTLGVHRWTYQFPSPFSSSWNYGVVDASGNLVYLYDSSNFHFKLLKLTPAGEKIFDIALPSGQSISGWWWYGPVVNASGNVWAVRFLDVPMQSKGGAMTMEGDNVLLDAFLFDGTTGGILMKKTIIKEPLALFRTYANGKHTELYNENNVGELLATFGDNLVAAGSWWTSNATCKPLRGCKSTDKSEWRAYMISPQGDKSLFRFRGDGRYQTSTDKGDGNSNTLNRISIMGNALILQGVIARGRASDPSGLVFDDVLMRIDPSTKRILWKSTLRGAGNIGLAYCFYPPDQKIFRQRPADLYTFDVINTGGAVGTTPLHFPYGIGDHDYVSFVWGGPSLPNGSFFAGYGNLLIKYDIEEFLPQATFVQQPDEVSDQRTETFAVTQNFPNPFNPTTAIEFELASDALVTVKIYNTLGQEIKTLAEKEWYGEGYNDMQFDGSGLSSGVYYYHITAEDIDGKGILYSNVRKMLMIK